MQLKSPSEKVVPKYGTCEFVGCEMLCDSLYCYLHNDLSFEEEKVAASDLWVFVIMTFGALLGILFVRKLLQ